MEHRAAAQPRARPTPAVGHPAHDLEHSARSNHGGARLGTALTELVAVIGGVDPSTMTVDARSARRIVAALVDVTAPN
jgi:hypothetical protein